MNLSHRLWVALATLPRLVILAILRPALLPTTTGRAEWPDPLTVSGTVKGGWRGLSTQYQVTYVAYHVHSSGQSMNHGSRQWGDSTYVAVVNVRSGRVSAVMRTLSPYPSPTPNHQPLAT
jgi:hypothetical protein